MGFSLLRQILPIWMDSQSISETTVSGFVNKCQSTSTSDEKRNEARERLEEKNAINDTNKKEKKFPSRFQSFAEQTNNDRICVVSSPLGRCGNFNPVKQCQRTKCRFEYWSETYFNKIHNLTNYVNVSIIIDIINEKNHRPSVMV